MHTTQKAFLITTALSVAVLAAALVTPEPHADDRGPTGADCRLMAQALRENYGTASVIASDHSCAWRQLGFRSAVDVRTLDPDEGFVGFRSVDRPRYSPLRIRAQIELGSQVAELAGMGRRCTYLRAFGNWYRTECEEPTWIS